MSNPELDPKLEALLLAHAKGAVAAREVPLDLVNGYLDGTLDEPDRERFDRWLEQDPSAAPFMAEYREVRAEGGRALHGLSPTLLDALGARLRETSPMPTVPEAMVTAPAPPARTGAWRKISLSGAALGAALAAVLWWTWPTARSADFEVFGEPRVYGRPSALPTRGAPTAPPRDREATSQDLVAEFPPVEASATTRSAQLATFRRDSTGRLSRLRSTVLREEREGKLSIRIDVAASELELPVVDLDAVVFVFAAPGVDLEELEGARFSDVRARGDLRVMEKKLQPHATGPPESIRIYGFDWIITRAVGQTFGFWAGTGPVVRMDGVDAGDWSLTAVLDGRRFPIRTTSERRASGLLLRGALEDPNMVGSGRLVLESQSGAPVASWAVQWRGAPEAVHRAQALREERDHSGAVAALQPVLRDPSPWTRLWAEVERGKIAFREGQPEEAKRAWRAAIAHAEAIGVESEVSKRLGTLAYLEMLGGSHVAAMRLLNEAAERSQRLNDDAGLASTEYLLAMVEQRMGLPASFLSSKRRYERALDFADRAGDQSLALHFAGMLATLHVEHGQLVRAEQLLERYAPDDVASATDRLQHEMRVAFAAQVKLDARLMWDGESVSSAADIIAHAERTLELARTSGTRSDVGYMLRHLARLSLMVGRDDDTQRWIERSLAHGDPNETVFVLPLIQVELALRRGQLFGLERKVRDVRRALLARNDGAETEGSADALRLLGDLEMARGRTSNALAAYALAEGAWQELGQSFVTPQSRGFERHRRSRAHRQRVHLLLEGGRAEDALVLIEQRRRRTLQELEVQLGPTRHASEWAAYTSARASWAERFPDGCQGAKEDFGANTCSGLRAASMAALQAYQAAVWGDLSEMTRPPTPAEVLRDIANLPPHRTVLVVERLASDWVVFLVTQDGLQFRRGLDPFALWLPELLGAGHLLVSAGDDPVALRFPEYVLSDGRVLGEAIAISLVPSIRPVRANKPATSEWLIVSDPASDLRHAREEASWLTELAPVARAFTGDDVRSAPILELLSRVELFHFAGHGTLSAVDPWVTELRLGGGATLEFEEVLRVGRTPPVVVLNGCDTGPIPGGRMLGLPEAFLISGTQAVLATVSEMKDDEARNFIEAFYRHGGVDRPAEALRLATAESVAAGRSTWRLFRLWGYR